MLDHKSQMGYRKDSPYKNDPFIDIFSPEGKIDMSRTDKDIVGIDEYGNVQMMVGGRKQMYQFEGQQVREIPLDQLAKGGLTSSKAKEMLRDGTAQGKKLTKKQKGYFGWVAGGKKQMGGNPYNSASNYLTDFLFEEDEPEQIQQPEVVEEEEIDLTELRRQEQEMRDEEDYNMALQIAMQAGENPYSSESSLPTGTGGSAPAGFRTFGSYQEGRAALENQLNLYKTGRTKNPVKPTSTLYEAMSVYAPAADKNDPKNYANFIARKLGISVDTPIYKIDTGKWADAITIMEGNKRGNNPGNLRPSR